MRPTKCACGSRHNLSKHILAGGGWITLSEYTCDKCREKYMKENGNAFQELMKAARNHAKEMANNG